MGLDMYLYKMNYVKNWDHQSKEEQHTIRIERGGKLRTDILPQRIVYVVEEVAYWRKANAIHRWFVENVQRGNDDCGEYYVGRDKLQNLKDACHKVLAASVLINGKVKNGERYENGVWCQILEDGKTIANADVAHDILPTQEGFFFGSTDYDEWYYKDIAYTRDTLAKVLDEPGDEFKYSSSW